MRDKQLIKEALEYGLLFCTLKYLIEFILK